MALSVSEIVQSIKGVVRLARFDASGMAFLDTTPEGALRSFWVALLVLPPYALLIAVRDGGELTDLPLGYTLLVESLAYVVGWTAFPAVMHIVARLMDRADEYPAMVAAYNWSAVLQMVLQLPLILLMLGGIVDDDGGIGYAFVILAIIMVYIWFILKTSLRINGIAAAGLVIIELLTTALVSDYANHLLSLAADVSE